MRKKAAEDKKANRGTKCGSQGDKRRQRIGHGRQSGPKQAAGISDRCSKAHWFEAWSGMGPEKKARAVRRLRKPEWVMDAPHEARHGTETGSGWNTGRPQGMTGAGVSPAIDHEILGGQLKSIRWNSFVCGKVRLGELNSISSHTWVVCG